MALPLTYKLGRKANSRDGEGMLTVVGALLCVGLVIAVAMSLTFELPALLNGRWIQADRRDGN